MQPYSQHSHPETYRFCRHSRKLNEIGTWSGLLNLYILLDVFCTYVHSDENEKPTSILVLNELRVQGADQTIMTVDITVFHSRESNLILLSISHRTCLKISNL
jgi:hypothetical protein